MQSITSSGFVRNTFNNSQINKILMNTSRNSFRNLNFQYNSYSSQLENITGKRNIILPTGVYINKNGACSNVTQSSTLAMFKNSMKWNSVRFFSKDNFNLDKSSNSNGKEQVKIDTEKFIIGFTCKKCNNRSYKFISKKSYYEGVVIIRCDKCKNLHLIADHLGWYDSMNKFGTIEDYFKRQENNPSGNKTVIKKNLQQLTRTEQNDVIEFLKEEQKELNEKEK